MTVHVHSAQHFDDVELRLFIEELACNICRFMHTSWNGVEPQPVRIRQEVQWAWAPGYPRRPAPGTQAQAGALAEAWVKTGAACPH
jgi:hypothetical protein